MARKRADGYRFAFITYSEQNVRQGNSVLYGIRFYLSIFRFTLIEDSFLDAGSDAGGEPDA